ncbi:similar to Saccharomyces cerevisiae YPL160W CDC60 Cytosolic leucyl tRNA synthetase, ligates leucine to the appropriate tRNA [Maudiozyma barnettii]|uniref:leucine--tRNA ligase n=1 Tax=Maudiozyma barnettii TaxID=61262 RepID=A0A8H2VCP6_9SACH|nr:leucine--tRNA ligase CDC60 [Kazachstania barnettii]CAB4252885.1 similar to Saccharomyces cerevisiae YPL160W CDC60 Cytosolic leucyl tRNA synthetase, ligates leucine to the appropriate tRNA [Kazachstania barnettii]CAD1780680.1 similar to Saccharomyces cerevisiae YPL160W CDC60 Cytosolic leucyl tRNA synthetase, ligates leucine to the appropriate tRNA [Kazachstania barnettii]
MSTEASGLVLENTSRRDALIAIEKKYQKIWAEEHQFELDAPSIDDEPVTMDSEELHRKYPKFMASMAYPYMNGVLHAGHCFTLSKVEFSVGFERMNGKRALFPLGFHCTGMPILACADKLKREAELFGTDYSNVPAEDAEEEVKPEIKEEAVDPTKFKAKKSKAQAKKGRGKYQCEIMMQLGIAREDVIKFADAQYWLTYFPPLCQDDCTSIGARIDWRRSYITTDANPYYDAFIRWQMNRLKGLGKIKFGERYTIYSEKDGQPCMDHDRQSGEGVAPQEYIGIKIEATEFAKDAQVLLDGCAAIDKSKKLYFIAATLRPETMYGQTCCFVSPTIEYGIFDNGDSYYITTKRAFKNMSFQKLTPTRGSYEPILTIPGKAFIGSKIDAPLSVYKDLRILPMETVIATKGTGVVTCVPSNSPDDYITTKDLAHKPEYYGIDPSWVKPLDEIVPLIKSQKHGEIIAKALVEELKIQSPKDKNALAEAKKIAYKEDYYGGVMIYGPFAGEKVEVAKNKVKEQMIADGHCFVYNEPEGVVMSRSGDECIVSLEDQWYLDYGEETWKAEALECLEGMEVFAPEVKNAFEGVLDWLKNWAVSRSYGLGTRIPWDPKYLVESLSDSTIYQCFYTIAHLLFKDYYGQEVGPLNIKAEQMTDEVFDYIFQHTDDVETDIPIKSLQKMRREFEYFYPLDVSISGKDLIGNHLTFFIYNHVALFPKKFWPKGIRANGHLMLNNAKMSKSTGNFMTLKQIVEKFGADASRIALADAGDTVEDANFEESSANAAILRLFNLKEWAEDIVKNQDTLRTGPITDFFDVSFENEMNVLIEKTHEQYSLTNYKNALKYGLFDFQTARDYYRDSCETMHKDLVLRYIEFQALALAPITPHFCEYIYREVLGKSGSVQNTAFPRASKPVDMKALAALTYVRDLQRSIREAEGQALKKKKGKTADVDTSKPIKLSILISEDFPEWQSDCVEVVRKLFEEHTLDDNKKVREHINPKEMKRAMPFINLLKQRLAVEPAEDVLSREIQFNEIETIKSTIESLKSASQTLNTTEFSIISFSQGAKTGKDIFTGAEVELTHPARVIDRALPGNPGVIFSNI